MLCQHLSQSIENGGILGIDLSRHPRQACTTIPEACARPRDWEVPFQRTESRCPPTSEHKYEPEPRSLWRARLCASRCELLRPCLVSDASTGAGPTGKSSRSARGSRKRRPPQNHALRVRLQSGRGSGGEWLPSLPQPNYEGYQADARPWERAWAWRASCRSFISAASFFPVSSS